MRRKKKDDFELEGALVDEEVKVIWEDVSHFEDMTYDQIRKQKPLLYTSRGIVLEDGEKYLIVASTSGSDKTYREATRIPYPLVRNIKKMKED